MRPRRVWSDVPAFLAAMTLGQPSKGAEGDVSAAVAVRIRWPRLLALYLLVIGRARLVRA